MDKDKLLEDQFNDDLSDIPSDCESIEDEHIESDSSDSDIIPRKKDAYIFYLKVILK